MKISPCLIGVLLLLGACARPADPTVEKELASLRTEVTALRAARTDQAATAPTAELGQQMLGLQIRHARLWAAGENENWLLAQFQLAALNKALDEVAEQNGDHAALQPQRLADVLPAIMKPAVTQLRTAIDNRDRTAFETGYDALSAACSGCHQVAGHGFLIIQRPTTPVLDNLKARL
jgi:hypothetical protein